MSGILRTLQLALCDLKSFSSQIVIMGKHYSGGTLGDIAIDDLTFDNCAQRPPQGSCSGSNAFLCDSGHCVDNSQKCDFEPDCCDGSEERNSTCIAYNRYVMCLFFRCVIFLSPQGSSPTAL